MDYTSYSDLWSFIEDYLLNYYSRDDVLRSDILFRYINNEDVSESDVEWIGQEFGTDLDSIRQESIRLEKKFVYESLDNFYEQLMEIKHINETL